MDAQLCPRISLFLHLILHNDCFHLAPAVTTAHRAFHLSYCELTAFGLACTTLDFTS